MTTIKGPITIGKGGKSVADLVKGGNVKLPFVATGWSSTKNSDLITGEQAPKKVEIPIEEPVAVIEDEIVEAKPRRVFKKIK